jgi:hypothetical protein
MRLWKHCIFNCPSAYFGNIHSWNWCSEFRSFIIVRSPINFICIMPNLKLRSHNWLSHWSTLGWNRSSSRCNKFASRYFLSNKWSIMAKSIHQRQRRILWYSSQSMRFRNHLVLTISPRCYITDIW